MNVIRDIFSILIILCVLCLQFDTVKASQLQERESNLSVTLTSAKNELHGRKEIMVKKRSKKLHNGLKDSNRTVILSTTKTEIEGSKNSTRKRNSEKLLSKHEKSNRKDTFNTTKTGIKEKIESAKKRKSVKLRNQHKKLSGEVRVNMTRKNGEESGESTRKRKSQELLNHDEESRKGNWKEIAEQKNNEVDQGSRKQLSDNANDKKDDEEDPELQDLNVYSLREDMIRLLGSIPNINASVGVIGRTAEYNDIVLCKITEYSKTKKPTRLRAKVENDKYTDEEAEKKIIFIVHGLSAMGFNAVPCLYQEKEFTKLVQFYTEHLDKFDIYLIPIANPDGVSDQGTLSNKNKSPQTACSGVALDRNFDISWNAFHVNSCHQQYPGPSAFSEPEARAVGDILHQFNNRIAAYIHVHAGSYSADVYKGDAVLYPKGFVEFNSDDDKYMDIKGEIDEALRMAGLKVMTVTVDSLYSWYGKVTGTSVDYASSVYGVPYALEFVMQPYLDSVGAASTEKTSENVLTVVWKRVLDVVFTNINRSQQNNEVLK